MGRRDFIIQARSTPDEGAGLVRRIRVGNFDLAPFQRQALVAALRAFVLSRFLLLGVTCLTALIRGQQPIAIWNQWDTVWYLGIASHGYHWAAPGHEATSYPGASLAFFPLFPLLLRGLETMAIPGIIAGLVIANLAFFGALVYLYCLLREEWGAGASRLALILLAVFPSAFFTFAPYTESLFLLAAAGTLYHAHRGQAGLAGFWLAVALLTHSTGIILVIPAALMLQLQTLRGWLLFLGPAALGWAGSLAYLLRDGLPITLLLNAQHGWHRALTFPWTGFIASVQWLARHGWSQSAMAADNVFSLGVTLVFLALTAVAWRDLNLPMRIYCTGFWVLTLLSPQWLDGYYAPFGSMDRFVLALFPLAGWAAKRLGHRKLSPVLAISALGMVVMASLHVSGVWVG